MSEIYSEHLNEGEFMAVRPTGAFVTPEGALSTGDLISNFDDRDRQKQALAEAYEVSPVDIVFPDSEPDHPVARRGRRLQVAFSRWNSSWDPQAAPADPNLN